jgi:collagen type IV alpha
MTLWMRGTSSSRRQAVIIGAVLAAAVAVPKALADGSPVVPVDGAALAAAAISASTPVVPEAPAVPIVPETGTVSPVSAVIPPAVSPPPPLPPTPGSPAGTPQSLAGEPAGGSGSAAPEGDGSAAPDAGKTPTAISPDITKHQPVILHHRRAKKIVKTPVKSCSHSTSCKTPEPFPRGAAAASVRGRARELPSPGVTVTGLARGRAAPHPANRPRPANPHRAKEHARRDAGGDAGGAQAPVPLVPEPPGRSPEAPAPSTLTFSSPGAHGTGSFTVSASVTAFGVAAARAPTTAAHSTSVPLRRRESDERIDRPG